MPVYYPVFLNLEDRLCVVVGAGAVGTRKATGLLTAGARVRLVAPDISSEAELVAKSENVELKREQFRVEHLDLAVLVIAATSNRQINRTIIVEAEKRGILSNSADAPEDGTFISPSVLRRGDLSIAVTTGGASPMLAAHIREELGLRYDEEYAHFVELLGAIRSYIKEHSANAEVRSAIFDRLISYESDLRQLLREAGIEAASREARHIIDAASATGLE